MVPALAFFLHSPSNHGPGELCRHVRHWHPRVTHRPLPPSLPRILWPPVSPTVKNELYDGCGIIGRGVEAYSHHDLEFLVVSGVQFLSGAHLGQVLSWALLAIRSGGAPWGL